MAETTKRIFSGIDGFDEAIEGGFVPGSLTLLSGHCGTGRRTFAMQFLVRGAQGGQNGVFISLEKEPSDVIENVERYGWGVEELVKKKKLSIIKPSLHRFDALKQSIEDEVVRTGARRLVISPFSLLTAYIGTTYDARKMLSELRRLMKKLDCTALAVVDIPEGEAAYSPSGFEEFVAGGVLVMGLVIKKDGSSYARTLLVRKMERTAHSLKLIPIEMEADGIHAYPDAAVGHNSGYFSLMTR